MRKPFPCRGCERRVAGLVDGRSKLDIPFLSSILGLALLDGLNLCGLALITFFMAVMISGRVKRTRMIAVGLVYAVGLSGIYLALGYGLLNLAGGLAIFSTPHLLTRLASIGMVAVGAVNLYRWFNPHFLHALPHRMLRFVGDLAARASLPTSLIAGVAVGLHNFPCACTAMIYPTAIGLLSALPSRLEANALLLVYNVVYVLPVMLLTALASSPKVNERVSELRRRNERRLHLMLGVVMVTVGFTLAFLVNYANLP